MISSLWSARPRTCAGSGWLKLPFLTANPPHAYLGWCWRRITHTASNLSPCWPWTTTTCRTKKYRLLEIWYSWFVSTCSQDRAKGEISQIILVYWLLLVYRIMLVPPTHPPPQALCCTQKFRLIYIRGMTASILNVLVILVFSLILQSLQSQKLWRLHKWHKWGCGV